MSYTICFSLLFFFALTDLGFGFVFRCLKISSTLRNHFSLYVYGFKILLFVLTSVLFLTKKFVDYEKALKFLKSEFKLHSYDIFIYNKKNLLL